MLIRLPMHEVRRIWQDNPHLKQVEEFRPLSAKQMAFVALYSDPFSPALYMRYAKEMDDKQWRQYIVNKLSFDGPKLKSTARSIVRGKVGMVEAAIVVYKHAWPLQPEYELHRSLYRNLQEYVAMDIGHKNFSIAKQLQILNGGLIEKAKENMEKCLEQYRERSSWWDSNIDRFAGREPLPLRKTKWGFTHVENEDPIEVTEPDLPEEEMWDVNE